MDVQEKIIAEFALFDNKQDIYNYIIELGKALPLLDSEYKTEKNIIKACQSKVWLASRLNNGKVYFYSDSDSVLVKGLISLFLRIYSGQTPQQILDTDAFCIESIGLKQMLSMTRANGLAAMDKQIKLYALAYKIKER